LKVIGNNGKKKRVDITIEKSLGELIRGGSEDCVARILRPRERTGEIQRLKINIHLHGSVESGEKHEGNVSRRTSGKIETSKDEEKAQELDISMRGVRGLYRREGKRGKPRLVKSRF